jgi:hypothetical protein
MPVEGGYYILVRKEFDSNVVPSPDYDGGPDVTEGI